MNNNLNTDESTYNDDNTASCPICGAAMKEKQG